ncbi:MAG: hypothetical protein IPJ88_13055 [Myxococcales bacterium]|nr:MAG: hypothetical protein IPJ88_13055 [Myxococcales bacterium]
MIRSFLLSMSCSAFALPTFSCSSDDSSSSGGELIDNPAAAQSATQAVEDLNAFQALSTNEQDSAAIGQVYGLFGNYQSMLNAKLATQNSAAALSTSAIDLSEIEAFFAKGDFPDCVTNASGTVTYNDCSVNGIYTIDGTLEVSATGFTSNLTISSDLGGSSTSITMTGSLTLSDTEISGSVNQTVAINAGGNTLDYTINADYDITLSDGCATAGTLKVDGNWSTGTSGGDYDLNITATFGPTCGDVVLS